MSTFTATSRPYSEAIDDAKAAGEIIQRRGGSVVVRTSIGLVFTSADDPALPVPSAA